jgi:hypothetical protein
MDEKPELTDEEYWRQIHERKNSIRRLEEFNERMRREIEELKIARVAQAALRAYRTAELQLAIKATYDKRARRRYRRRYLRWRSVLP